MCCMCSADGKAEPEHVYSASESDEGCNGYGFTAEPVYSTSVSERDKDATMVKDEVSADMDTGIDRYKAQYSKTSDKHQFCASEQ